MSGLVFAVVADDFTGANDCAGALAQAGLLAWSMRGDFLPARPAQALLRSMETRFLGPAEARRRSRRAWQALRGQSRQISYQRIDSTLRGNPAEEIEGLFEAEAPKHLAFCAAYPAHGRVIRGGVASVRGVRLDKSEYARDPLTASRGAWPARLFRHAFASPIGLGNVASLRKKIRAARGRVLSFDAVTEADLGVVAAACLAEGIRHYAGSSGLSSALAARLGWRVAPQIPPLPSRRAVLAGTVSQTSLEQLGALEAQGLAPWIDLEGGPTKMTRENFALSSLRQRASLRRFSSVAAQKTFADARMLALVRRGLKLAGDPFSVFWLLTGGHCAETFFRVLKLRGSRARGMLFPGLPLLEAFDDQGRQIWICSKPGGFGDKMLMSHFMRVDQRR